MKVINIPVLGSFVKYSDYEHQSKTLQDVTTNNKELYKKEQEALQLLKNREDNNLDLHNKNIKLYKDNTKLNTQLNQVKYDSTKMFKWYILLIIAQAVVFNLIYYLN